MAYEQRERPAQSVRKSAALTLEGREHLTVSGVEEVLRFDEREVSMRTGEGELTIRGEGMSISALSTGGGDIHVHGRVDALCYEESAPERGLWARLFR